MAVATAPTAPTAPTRVSTEELVLLLSDGPMPVAEVQAKVPGAVFKLAWARGEIEFGRVNHCVTGAPDGRHCIPGAREEDKRIGSTLVIETGRNWPLPPGLLEYAPLADILAEAMPEAKYYQIYQQEVLTSRPNEPERWEWVGSSTATGGRETRFARRDATRAECERYWGLHMRLTRKGRTAIQGE